MLEGFTVVHRSMFQLLNKVTVPTVSMGELIDSHFGESYHATDPL